MLALTKQFRFDAAHTLHRDVEAEASRRIHGHSYRAEVTIQGWPDPATGMILDLTTFERLLDGVRDALDHRFLDEIADLGPATLENLCLWIWKQLKPDVPPLARVAVYRDSAGESCVFDGLEG